MSGRSECLDAAKQISAAENSAFTKSKQVFTSIVTGNHLVILLADVLRFFFFFPSLTIMSFNVFRGPDDCL